MHFFKKKQKLLLNAQLSLKSCQSGISVTEKNASNSFHYLKNHYSNISKSWQMEHNIIFQF